jgi:hypothetical protein
MVLRLAGFVVVDVILVVGTGTGTGELFDLDSNTWQLTLDSSRVEGVVLTVIDPSRTHQQTSPVGP